MDVIIKHFEDCEKITLDSESVDRPSNLALIQVQSIPSILPSFVLLVQLDHLPPANSNLFSKIKYLFKVLFEKNKTIYTWGPLQNEIEYGSQYSIFSYPIEAKDVNLQSEFSKWYSRVPSYCEVCKPSNDTHVTVGSSMFCECREHAYNDPSKPWSLQNAILYAGNSFLDKSQTENNWFSMLDPKYTTLHPVKLENIINYAVYDCISLAYLRLPVVERWSLVRLEETPISILLTDPKQAVVDPDLEDISDDELPPLLNGNRVEQNDEVIGEVLDADINVEYPSTVEQNLPSPRFHRSCKHTDRSVGARAYRNKKRYAAQRARRYPDHLTRYLYRRFTRKMVGKIFKKLQIKFKYIKRDGNQVLIGMKNEELKEQFDKLLPLDMFDKDHYHNN
ncbi:unnamed protein product [Adineta steineri]|uniref:Uncharacterized protein n=1 Tax=Adineta steineri TaxID=433720 RepID=A0A815QH60_9BILA|nr:unnamed protein product [Adineta steineri]CAF3995890.1 unnamed protein product [Adineta steineri]